MNETLVKYLAGLLDADGSLCFSFKESTNAGNHYIGLVLSLASSEAVDKHGFVDGLPKQTGMGTISRYGKTKQFKTWSIAKRAHLEKMLPRLIKHMVIKAAHWQWLLDQWREKRAHSTTVTSIERSWLSQASKVSRVTRNHPLKPKNHPTWAWLAGYMDGDGWYSYRFGVYNGYRQYTISCGAVAHETDIAVLKFLQRSFGGQIRNKHQSEKVFVWNRSLGYQNRSFALRFLKKLARHSKLKRHKIDAIIHHHSQRLTKPGTEKTYCTVEGCDRPSHGHGLCFKHYQRKRRNVQETV